MNNQIQNNKNLSQRAKQFTKDRQESIYYFLQNGSSFEKAVAMAVVELAEGVNE
jgi:hypothetical protein